MISAKRRGTCNDDDAAPAVAEIDALRHLAPTDGQEQTRAGRGESAIELGNELSDERLRVRPVVALRS